MLSLSSVVSDFWNSSMWQSPRGLHIYPEHHLFRLPTCLLHLHLHQTEQGGLIDVSLLVCLPVWLSVLAIFLSLSLSLSLCPCLSINLPSIRTRPNITYYKYTIGMNSGCDPRVSICEVDRVAASAGSHSFGEYPYSRPIIVFIRSLVDRYIRNIWDSFVKVPTTYSSKAYFQY